MENQSSSKQDDDALGGCLIRLFWMFLGNAMLFLCAMAMAQEASGWFGPIDALFWALVGSLLIARYVDIAHFNGKTAEGNVATLADFKRYASILLVVSVGLWAGAHVVGSLASDAPDERSWMNRASSHNVQREVCGGICDRVCPWDAAFQDAVGSGARASGLHAASRLRMGVGA
jgi:hypothetical protein